MQERRRKSEIIKKQNNRFLYSSSDSFVMSCVTGLLSGICVCTWKYDVKVILGLGIGCALSTVQFWVKTGIIELIASIIISVTLFYFVTLTETVGSYADYLNNIVAFGHSELIGQMNVTVIITAITAILGIVGCFVSGQKKQKNE